MSLRRLVSKRKRRFVQDGFDLDLVYVNPRLICMGYPAIAIEASYRNPLNEVQRFFESYHANHFWIFNLCSESSRHYDPAAFGGRVSTFGFDDHHPPCLLMMANLCLRALQFYAADDRNVIAIHCKAGKGRAGSAACCIMVLLQYLGIRQEERSQSVLNRMVYPEVIQAYGRLRAVDGKGVTIPSQIRYVGYFEKIVRMNLETVLSRPMFRVRISSYPKPRRLRLLEVSIVGAPVQSLSLMVISYSSYYAPEGAELLHPDNTSKSGGVLYYNLSDVLHTVTEEKFSDAEDCSREGSSGRHSHRGAGGRGSKSHEPDANAQDPGAKGPKPQDTAWDDDQEEREAMGPHPIGSHPGPLARQASASERGFPPEIRDAPGHNPVREILHGEAEQKEAGPIGFPLSGLAQASGAGEMLVFSNPIRRRISKPSTVHFHGTIEVTSNLPIRFQAALSALLVITRGDAGDDSLGASAGGIGLQGSLLENSDERSFSAVGAQGGYNASPLRPWSKAGALSAFPTAAGTSGGVQGPVGSPGITPAVSAVSVVPVVPAVPAVSGVSAASAVSAYSGQHAHRALHAAGEKGAVHLPRDGSPVADPAARVSRAQALWPGRNLIHGGPAQASSLAFSAAASQASSLVSTPWPAQMAVPGPPISRDSDVESSGNVSQAYSAERRRAGPAAGSAPYLGPGEAISSARRRRGLISRGSASSAAGMQRGEQGAEAGGGERAAFSVSNSLVTFCDEVYIEGYNAKRSRRYFYTHFNTAMIEHVLDNLYYFSVPGTQLDEACKKKEWHGCRLSLKCAEV